MTQSSVAVTHRRRRSITTAVVLVVVGIVLMAATAFFHLIDEPQVIPYSWMVAPVIAGILGAALVGTDRGLDRDRRHLWVAGLVCTGLMALAVALVLIRYVLPLGG